MDNFDKDSEKVILKDNENESEAIVTDGNKFEEKLEENSENLENSNNLEETENFEKLESNDIYENNEKVDVNHTNVTTIVSEPPIDELKEKEMRMAEAKNIDLESKTVV